MTNLTAYDMIHFTVLDEEILIETVQRMHIRTLKLYNIQLVLL